MLVHEEHLVPGADEFIAELTERDANYLVVTNNPIFTRRDLVARLSMTGITTAIRLIDKGARFVSTNPDPTGPSRYGLLPAAGAVAALIEKATGRSPYFVGKPNPLMMRSALRSIGAHSESALMVGDRMDTDVIAGLEAGLASILVLTGISTRESIQRYPYRPSPILDSIADLVGGTADPFGDSG